MALCVPAQLFGRLTVCNLQQKPPSVGMGSSFKNALGETRTLTPFWAQALNLLRMPIPPPGQLNFTARIIPRSGESVKRGRVLEFMPISNA